MTSAFILNVRGLKQHFRINDALTIKAVDGVSFAVRPGEIFGLVGESGSGKSTVARSIMGIYPPTEGEILFKGHVISEKKAYRRHKADIQRSMQVIFQDSAASLNPRMKIADIIAEPLVIHKVYPESEQRREEVNRLLQLVGLDEGYGTRWPGELSGGQRQRVAIARALAARPELIVADEPVASLDVSIQAQIINLFQELQRERRFAFLFIAHDLAMVRYLCDRVGVMFAGKMVEAAPVESLFTSPRHPYTRALLSAIPLPDPRAERGKAILSYTPPEEDAWGEYVEVAPSHFVLQK